MKYTAAYPSKPFAGLSKAHEWVHRFATWYNEQHRHSGIQFVTPRQLHRGQDKMLLAARTAIYEQAKQRRPDRWSGKTRNWDTAGPV